MIDYAYFGLFSIKGYVGSKLEMAKGNERLYSSRALRDLEQILEHVNETIEKVQREREQTATSE